MRIIYTPCHSHTYPGQGYRFPRRHSSWELEFRQCGAIPGWGLLLIEERRMEGMWGRRLWWEMSVEESQGAMEARWYCWVMHRGWSHHHSLSLPTGQHWQLNSREAGPLNAWRTELQSRTPPRVLFKCLTHLQSRTPARGAPLCAWNTKQQTRTLGKTPSKCLNRWSYGERLAKEAFWLPATRGLKKDSDRAITPAAEAVSVPAHLVPPGPRKPSSCHTFTLNPHWGRGATGKKSCVYAHRVASVMSNSL